jgi:hypothetical protein
VRNDVIVRVLVPKRDREGKVEYHLEMQIIRLPLRREDRKAFKERLSGD